jgi:predicted O-linked N-acetylglucosamine transferase (SPINDLY family)
MTADQAANLVYSDKVHILFDLAGHTAFNRLDIFALKPSPIQVTYIGYPYSTGLTEMDYRITDIICDKIEVSQKFYTEQLIMLDNCFLCYDPTIIKRGSKGKPASFEIPTLGPQPIIREISEHKNARVLRIGCFNRVNKITDSVIKEINKLMLYFGTDNNYGTVHFLFKTKALINTDIQKQFLNKFDKVVRDRITILDCTISHEDHLLEYNKVDIALDTFPYSGTTTSCEALLMGVPVFSIWDKQWWFHCSNVTVSILHNSDLSYYVVDNINELYTKIEELFQQDDDNFWSNLKQKVRQKFLTGNVCNKELYMTNFTKLLCELYITKKQS